MPDKDADLGRFAEPSPYTLASLIEGPKHGYAIVTDVERITGLPIGPGTRVRGFTRTGLDRLRDTTP